MDLNIGTKGYHMNAYEVEQLLQKASAMYKSEPSSAVVFAALSKIKFDKDDKIILINSGRGIF